MILSLIILNSVVIISRILAELPQTLTSSNNLILSASSKLSGSKLEDGIFKMAKVNKGFWCPNEARNNLMNEKSDWFQIDFQVPKVVNFISSNVKFYSNNPEAYDKTNVFIYLKYQREDAADNEGSNQKWYNYSSSTPLMATTTQARFNYGSPSHDGEVGKFKLIKIRPMMALNPPIVAKRIRVFTYYRETVRKLPTPLICLHVSLNGVSFQENLLEYNTRNEATPLKLAEITFDVSDNTYDGSILDNNRLSGGLGKLTDKVIHHSDSFEKAIKANAIVGWKRLSASQPRLDHNVTIIFKFNSTRKFTSLKLYSFANDIINVGHPHFLTIDASVSGVIYNQHTTRFEYNILSGQTSTGYLIDVSLSQDVIGRYLRMTLSSKFNWIFLSEVLVYSKNIFPDPGDEIAIKSDDYDDDDERVQTLSNLEGSSKRTDKDRQGDSISSLEQEDQGNESSPTDSSSSPTPSLLKKYQDYPELQIIQQARHPKESQVADESSLIDYNEITRKVQMDRMNQTLVTTIISISVPILIIFLVIILFMIFRWKFCRGHVGDKKSLTGQHNNNANGGNAKDFDDSDPLKGPMIRPNDFYEIPIGQYGNYPVSTVINNSQGNASTLLSPHQLIGYSNQFYTNNNSGTNNNHVQIPSTATSGHANQNYLALSMLHQTLQRNANPNNLHYPQQTGFLNPMNQFNTMQTNNSGDSCASGHHQHHPHHQKAEVQPKNTTSLTTSAGSYSSSSGNSTSENYVNQQHRTTNQPSNTSGSGGANCPAQQFFSQRVNMSLPPPPSQSPPPLPPQADSIIHQEPSSLSMNDNNSLGAEYASTSMLNVDMSGWNNYQQSLMNLHQVNPNTAAAAAAAALLLAQSQSQHQHQQDPLALLRAIQQNQSSLLYNSNTPDFQPPSTPPGGKTKSLRER